MVIGTKYGELRAYGRPGVEFKANSDGDSSIRYLFVISGLHQIISVSADNCISTWELATEGKPSLSLLEQFKLDSEGYVIMYHVCPCNGSMNRDNKDSGQLVVSIVRALLTAWGSLNNLEPLVKLFNIN